MKKFFIELFDFIFPPDFRNMQRKKLNRCYQNEKSVTAHVAEFIQIYSTIGLNDDQEKVVKIWNSFRGDIQQELYRDKLDPELSTWKEVVKAAERAEVLLKAGAKNNPSQNNSKSTQSQQGGSSQGNQNGSSSGRNNNTSRGGFESRGRGRRGRKNSAPRGVSFQTNAVHLPGNNKSSPPEKKMSAERRNEMLAKGLCFTCSEHGHVARDCPKSSTVKSKTKGKPPGSNTSQVASTSAVDNSLYEGTEVLETLRVGAILHDLLEVEEGGVPIQSSELQTMENFSFQHDDSPVNPIADECWQDERFGVCRLNDSEYIIFDHETNEEAMLEAKYLQCPEFKLGAWYTWRRMEALGLDPDAFPQDERFDIELGDALVDGACIWLGREARDPSRFEVEESGCGMLTIRDSILGVEVRLVKSKLLNEQFDLMAWCKAAFDAANATVGEPDLMSVPDTDFEWVSSESELEHFSESSSTPSGMPSLKSVSDTDSEASSTASDMPSLQSVSNSDAGSDVDDDPINYGTQAETWEDRLKLWEKATNENWDYSPQSSTEDLKIRTHLIGDLLGNAVAAYLEYMQPFPGNEDIWWSDERRERPRFTVTRISKDLYTVYDTFSEEITEMPVEYLRVPYFSLATYYAGLCAQRSEVRDYEPYELHREVIGELFADALQQYFAEVALEFPSFNDLSVSRVLREPDDLEGPDTFEINIPLEGRDIQEYIPEKDLMNPRLDMVK
ncbi:hypothetical protein DFH08DRAFT_966547 [Mycena albidolilacea]|uniref:CCHC-type domain-containing protein n=1 Tax=Mycena albidolilacea TaxID=1033008 RepID=A0AAD6ZPP7_9AGAR|nr:hypothetical protein DFH08DRAFT_966547 [Mycena albidolilacea]